MDFRVDICREGLIKSNAKSADYHACDEGKFDFAGDLNLDFLADYETVGKSLKIV